MTNTTRNGGGGGGYKLCFNLLVGWILILNQYRLHWVSEICNLQGPRELLVLQSRWDLSLIKCMCEESKGRGGGFTLCPVLQQWELASNNSLHSINCMELYCAINHKLIMIMLQQIRNIQWPALAMLLTATTVPSTWWTTLSAIPSLKKHELAECLSHQTLSV